MSYLSEETLLDDGHVQHARHRSHSASRERRFSAATLVIPIAIICRLAIMLPSTTNFRILEIAACRLWYYLNNPGAIPPGGGGIPDEMCKTGAVDKYYAAMSSLLSVGDGIGTVVGCAAAGYFGSRIGRKPVLLGVLSIAVIGQISVVFSQILGGWLEFVFFFVWAVCQTIGNAFTAIFVINMYIVDVSGAEERTAALSKIAGWAALGGALSFSLGGTITTQSHSTLTVYFVSSIILILSCIYIALILPESFPAFKRAELRRQREEEAPRIAQSWLEKVKSSMAMITEPLQLLKPAYDPATGRFNWRLLYCAIHVFIVTLADGYAVLAMILYFTAHYKYSPAQTGYVLTTLNITGVVVLTAIIPQIVRYLRPSYQRKQPVALPEEGLASENDGASSESKQEVVSETSDHLDVHITIGSWVIEAIAYLGVATTTTLTSQLASVVCIGLGAGRNPVFRSLVAASALASIEVVSSLSLIISPILMGSITTWTITSMPQTIFCVHATIILLGASVLFLIRDSDRYQKPRIVLE
ncbi:major facilitator superfamily domain-containing protein [Gymnopilus junonius]|uniref:Major facilitator superfamily domain-containing protein n=1 Tax=Gymnopilus junonius TaxID=109634 RepID=A0A9P5NUF7_GYMJU|nr:major facilitator superfamily domain-containing protein [Gymnopilus junonius]